MHGSRDLVPVRKLHASVKDMQRFRAKEAVLVVVFEAKTVFNRI